VMVISTTEMGCKDTAFVLLTITDDLKVYIPNAFTPNGDGRNDVFFVKGVGMKPDGFYMQIIDRWGTEVFSTKDINDSWDGKMNGEDAPIATYTYWIKIVGMNGEGRREFTGHVNLIR
jgi:gliding motility-associated-like protein